MEGDLRVLSDFISDKISIHTLRVEGDADYSRSFSAAQQFQSTPSEWRVTALYQHPRQFPAFQSTPSEWRVTLSFSVLSASLCISIHTLRVEGDHLPYALIFQRLISIHTLRVEGDNLKVQKNKKMSISIHTLRVEGDVGLDYFSKRRKYFNPHPPSGG